MGGEARTTKCLMRIRYKQGVKAGRNFDRICGAYLTNPAHVKQMWSYLQKAQPLVVVMSPPCTGMAGWAHVNQYLHPETHERSKAHSTKMGQLCGYNSKVPIEMPKTFHTRTP